MKRVFSLGLVRGVVVGVIGAGAGIGFLVLVRILLGLPGWVAEPAAAVGAITGTLAFLAGVGAFADWWRWAMGQEAGDPLIRTLMFLIGPVTSTLTPITRSSVSSTR